MSAIFFLAPQPVLINSSRQRLHTNVAVNASGTSSVFTGLGLTAVIATINVTGAVTGSSPSLTLILEELDPGDLTTILQTVTATAITATLNQRTVRMTLRYGDAVRVKWTVTGTTPVFNGVYTTLTAGITSPAMGAQLSADSLPVTLATNQAPTIVGQAWFNKITDGTSTAAVKAASTAAVAADPALVVTVSPNTPVKVWDGTSTAAVKAASTAAVAADPSLVVAVSPNTPVKVWDGTNTAAVKAASTAAATTDPALVVAVSPNSSIKVWDGTNVQPAGDVAARARFNKITDGTSTAAVKAATTAAVAADPSLVVALSPNSPVSLASGSQVTLAAGTQNVGDVDIASWVGGSTAPTVGQKAMASSIPVVIASDQFSADILATGTIGAANENVSVSVAGKQSIGVRISVGSLTGQLVAQDTYDGSTWNLCNFVDPLTGEYSWFLNVNSGSNPLYYIIPIVGGHTASVRILCNSYTSGTSGTISMRASPLPCNVHFAIPYNLVSKPLFVKTTDGTNSAAVKAASTAAVAADPALVVAVSPNNIVSVTPAPATSFVEQITGIPALGGTASSFTSQALTKGIQGIRNCSTGGQTVYVTRSTVTPTATNSWVLAVGESTPPLDCTNANQWKLLASSAGGAAAMIGC